MISDKTLCRMHQMLFKARSDIALCEALLNAEMISRVADKRREEIKINRIQYAENKDIKD